MQPILLYHQQTILFVLLHYLGDLDSSVSIVTSLRARQPGFISGNGTIYLFSETSKPTVKLIQPLFLEVKTPVSEGDKTLASPLPLHALIFNFCYVIHSHVPFRLDS